MKETDVVGHPHSAECFAPANVYIRFSAFFEVCDRMEFIHLLSSLLAQNWIAAWASAGAYPSSHRMKAGNTARTGLQSIEGHTHSHSHLEAIWGLQLI